MKALSLAGGLGARLSEETLLKPKPMDMLGVRNIKISYRIQKKN